MVNITTYQTLIESRTIFRLHNGLVLKLLRLHFPGNNHVASNEASLNGVTTHENGLFLYKSPQGKDFVNSRIYDYAWAGAFLAWASGAAPLMILPLFVLTLQIPRKISYVRYYTLHAELLPNTEQVCFHKATNFGDVERIYVDIRYLEKIEADRIDSGLFWQLNSFD